MILWSMQEISFCHFFTTCGLNVDFWFCGTSSSTEPMLDVIVFDVVFKKKTSDGFSFFFCHYDLCGGIFSFAISRLLCLFYHSTYVLGIYKKIFTESCATIHFNKPLINLHFSRKP